MSRQEKKQTLTDSCWSVKKIYEPRSFSEILSSIGRDIDLLCQERELNIPDAYLRFEVTAKWSSQAPEESEISDVHHLSVSCDLDFGQVETIVNSLFSSSVVPNSGAIESKYCLHQVGVYTVGSGSRIVLPPSFMDQLKDDLVVFTSGPGRSLLVTTKYIWDKWVSLKENDSAFNRDYYLNHQEPKKYHNRINRVMICETLAKYAGLSKGMDVVVFELKQDVLLFIPQYWYFKNLSNGMVTHIVRKAYFDLSWMDYDAVGRD